MTRLRTRLGCSILTAALLGGAWAYAQGPPVLGDEFSTSTQAYYDQFSTDCSRNNSSPYAGMDPLTCHGVMMPAASNGQCLGARGWQLLKQEGNTCYFCQPLDPPINGVIVPIDQLNQARIEGFKCGVDQADLNCMAVCTREVGSGPYVPPSGSYPIPQPKPPPLASGAGSGGCTPPENLSSDERAQWYRTYILSGHIKCPGAYDPCANPDAPGWCPTRSETPGASCGCADSNNPSVCDDGRSLGQRFCIRGYSGDEILCGDSSKFERGSLLRGHSTSPQQQLADWMLTDDAKAFSDSVTALFTKRLIVSPALRPHKGYMVGLQAQLSVTVARCANGAAMITKVELKNGLYRGIYRDASTGDFSFVMLQRPPPYYDLFIQSAINGATQLSQTSVALPSSCPTNEVGIIFYLKNWDAHLLRGLPVAIPVQVP
jgi:hypothetical protein